MPDPNGNNSLKDVQNILGFLLAGFAGVLGFLGLRSTEVTTVLRNNSRQASLIALILLFAVLAAVSSVVIRRDEKISWPWTAAIFLLVLDGLLWVIYVIPINADVRTADKVSLVSGIVVGVLAVAAIVFSFFALKSLHVPA